MNYADIVIYSLIAVGALSVIIYIYRWWKDAEETKSDIRYKIYSNIKETCKKFKNKKIKKIYLNSSKGLILLGKYQGECIDKEGFRDISFIPSNSSILDRLTGKVDILRCNLNPKHQISQKKGKKLEFRIPITEIKEGDNFYIIKAEGIMKEGYFYYPITSVKGEIINDTLQDYLRHRELCLTEIMYEQLSDFSKSVKKATTINPQVSLAKTFKEETISEKKVM